MNNHLLTYSKKKASLLLAFSLLVGTHVQAHEGHDHAQTKSCGDFDHYINAQWKKDNPVPSTESRWGSFNILAKSNEEKTQKVIDELLTKTYPKNSYQQQIADLYRSLTDVESRNKRGLTPLSNYFKLIDNAQTYNDLITLNAIIPGITLPVEGAVEQDLMDSKSMTFYLSHSGLTLDDKEYYLSDSEDKVKIREAFRQYLNNMEVLMGNSPKKAAKTAQQIFDLETDIAKYHMSKEDMRDPFKIYNKYSYEDLKKAAPTVNWDGYFKALNIKPDVVIVANQDIIKNYHKLIGKHSIETWKEYMKYHFVKNMASFLPESIEKENFSFFSTTMRGIKEQKPVKERAIRQIDRLLGEPVGRLFASKYFSPESKAKIEHMIENMRAVYADRINNLAWMSDETKREALHKLSTFKYKIGYPVKWTDYSKVDIQADKAFENVVKINSFNLKKNLSEFGKDVDPDKWEMNAHEVNAYYHPMYNEIVFPAGILQPPFYDAAGDDAANYGGIGGVIGHEFSHGFDDQGSKFDADGNLRDWWTPEDREKFTGLTNKLVNQYSKYEILPNLNVNGEYTLGENIADQGGVLLSYYALLKEYENKPEPPLVNGMNYKQRFFYGWATIWRNNSTDEAVKQLISIDPHAPAKARINVTLSNLEEFYDAFDCGTPQVKKDDRVIIW